ncbi:G4 quadruplex nucleic acid binding protein [Coniosporium tulheliwenetii]|uniref:G4 quadruplex nucleic acid binding protein n=1 Tax=Coniosporium tulheliwenetii TaxID=3383036 RepID=A0ACC2ZA70_9PEZI|nr:G4 quadruplex nucleic acid binding protein [Cladosporium sp. JES 115]
MATPSIDESLASLLQKTSLSSEVSSDADPVKASSSLFPDAHYNDAEKNEINQWLITASHIASPNEDQAKTAERLSSLNTHLSSRTTVLGSKPSIADLALYQHLAPVVSKWSAEERTGEQGYHHIVRYVDFVQNAPVFGLKLSDSEKVAIDPNDVKFTIKPIDAKAEKERKKKEKEAAAASAVSSGATPTTLTGEQNQPTEGGRKSKKDKAPDTPKDLGDKVGAAVGAAVPRRRKEREKPKQPKPQKAAAPEKPLSPSLIDLRVGHILKAIAHPNADSLYVSTIACGDAPGTENTSEYEGQVVRTVCSGLNGLIPLEEMQGRKVVTVCNLKPVTMRGIKSCAMVLAASPRVAEGEDSHGGPIELVNPPEGAEAGDRVFFEGWEGEPEPVLNPKKKIWETCQPGFTTTEGLEVGFEVDAVPQLAGEGAEKKTGVAKLRTSKGVCTVKSLKGATVR